MWLVYIIESNRGQLYTGITTDIERRLKEHASGKQGAKFFRQSRPAQIRYLEAHVDRSSASRREAEIKKMNRDQKIDMLENVDGCI